MNYYSWSDKFKKSFNRIFEFQTKRSYIMMKKGPRSILKWKFLCFRRIIFWQLNTRIWHYSLLLNSSQILTFILSLGTFSAKILSDFISVWLFGDEIFFRLENNWFFMWVLFGLILIATKIFDSKVTSHLRNFTLLFFLQYDPIRSFPMVIFSVFDKFNIFYY